MGFILSKSIPLSVTDVLKMHEIIGDGVIDRCGVIRETRVHIGSNKKFTLPADIDLNFQGNKSCYYERPSQPISFLIYKKFFYPI